MICLSPQQARNWKPAQGCTMPASARSPGAAVLSIAGSKSDCLALRRVPVTLTDLCVSVLLKATRLFSVVKESEAFF